MDPFNRMLKSAPFLKLLPALIAGILIQWYLKLPVTLIILLLSFCILTLLVTRFLPLHIKFNLRGLSGFIFLCIISLTGALCTWNKDARNGSGWAGNFSETSHAFLLTIKEPLVPKTASYKALASIDAIQQNNKWTPAKGNLLLYFKKERLPPNIQYGSQIIVQKRMQAITNSGNPAAFDYERFNLFQDIAGQIFVTQKDYTILQKNNANAFTKFLFTARSNTVRLLQKFIPGQKEQGVAEALLIGYRNDLDRDLVQAYSNTGVVHIIAISGLHLGMIYGLLIWILSFLPSSSLTCWAKSVVIIAVLWLFTLIAGAAPSILRSAVMLTFIVIGENIGRKTNMYNNLASSAFCLLVFNPFILWDVGFLLSYSAVAGIVIFMKPIYKLILFNNKLIDKVWQLSSVSIAAQIFTLPFIVYYFHQLPLLFLVTNLVAVPLAGFILYGEMILLATSSLSFIAVFIGKITGGLISFLNGFIEDINRMPFCVWSNLQLNVLQTVMFFIIIVTCAFWLMKNIRQMFFCLLIAITFFCGLRCFDFIERIRQQKLIVYNVPKYTAIDIIKGRKYSFLGDSILLQDGFLRNFHLNPSRVLYRTSPEKQVIQKTSLLVKANKSVMFINNNKIAYQNNTFTNPDIIIISGNPYLDIFSFCEKINPKMLVFDSSNPSWKIEKWKKDCDSLHLRFHSVPEQGAFVMDL